jgi:hypothetical protein
VAIVLVVIGTVADGFSRFVQYEDEDHPREK